MQTHTRTLFSIVAMMTTHLSTYLLDADKAISDASFVFCFCECHKPKSSSCQSQEYPAGIPGKEKDQLLSYFYLNFFSFDKQDLDI